MGKRVIHCGPSGSGLAAKICNNMVLGVQQVVVAEAMLLGQRLGLHPKVLASVINSSTGKCWASEVNNPVKGALEVPEGQAGPPAQRKYEGGFAASLMLKVCDFFLTFSLPWFKRRQGHGTGDWKRQDAEGAVTIRRKGGRGVRGDAEGES
jgi:3-hydroxyisobutyrate dehydrogenase-like beta-hydroxyacid dehydrogenase